MSDKLPQDWQSWVELDERDRRFAIADAAFWAGLSEGQQRVFLDEADWQEIRLVPEARQAKIDGLVSMDEICNHLGLTNVQVYWLMSTRKLSGGWLIGTTWKFDRGAVDRWVEGMGGLDTVKKDVEDQIAVHRAAQEAGASPG